MIEAFGTSDLDFVDGIIGQLANAGTQGPKADERGINFMLSIVKGVEPKDQVETMLATQMVAANDAALMFLRRATLDNQTFDGIEANVHRASRLMRIFNEQLEAMQKLKGKASQQKVTVEHVHVHEGSDIVAVFVGILQPSPSPRFAGRGDQTSSPARAQQI